VRGGKRKRHYKVTPEGMDALKNTKVIRDRMWAEV
jgi:hypothetical protein